MRSRKLHEFWPQAAAIFMLFVSLAATGCANVHANGSITAPSVVLSAAPSTINAGSSATLSASATNAAELTITGSDGSSYTIPPAGGTQQVTPAATTTYTATATGAGGKTTATAVVTVNGSTGGGATTVSITATPTTITAGATSTLTVTASNATTVKVTGSDGTSYTLQPTGGTQQVSPAATITYTATATGANGNVTATATVTVQPAPAKTTVAITANPATITAGATSTLTVTATNATAVKITGSDGTSYTLQPTGGTQQVSPAATTTYTATATGANGNATASATVTVQPAPANTTVAITASPTAITAGASSTLTVSATNATAVKVTGSDGTSYTLQPTGGTQQVSPAATTTYTATATGANGDVTATATVAVQPAAKTTVAITANPTTIAAGASSTLTVSATNATAVKVTGSDGTSYTLQPTGGTQQVSPAATTTYTATATGANGNVTATATLTVQPAANTTVAISANPATITAGATSTLTVTATNATAVKVTGSDGSAYTLQPTGGTQQVSPTATTTYTATATGANGNVTATATVTVQAAGNATVTITASPTTVAPGGTSTLTVTAANASAVKVTGSDGTSYTLSATGGTQQVTPTATTTYTATATNGSGSVTATATVQVTPSVTIVANPNTIQSGSSSTLQITAKNATQVTVTGTDGSSYTLPSAGGTQSVSPKSDTTYTATATNAAGSVTAQATVAVQAAGDITAVKHVVFMLQENHSFDNYFGMLNPYRKANGFNIGDDGKDYEIDGIDDKLTSISNQDDEGDTFPLFKLKSTCVDDMSSDWLASFGDVNRYDFSPTRPIVMDGFVHDAEGFAKSCTINGAICSGTFTDMKGQRAMGYYDQGFLNYYYYMASQFAVSDRWFSPVASRSVDNRIATFSGGTTQGLVKDPGTDGVGQLTAPTIFQELDQNNVSWKIYYTVTEGYCTDPSKCTGAAAFPATFFSNFGYANKYLYTNSSGAACAAPTQPSSVVGDSSNSFCIDPNHIAPLSQYYTDVTNNTLPSFAFIEAGYANDDEHPGSGQSVLSGQAGSAQVINALMSSASWSSTVFFFSFDEGGGPYDHVPPVPGHSNDFTSPALGSIPDISTIAVSPDSYGPCVPAGGTPTLHCDLSSGDPGATSTDAAAQQGFAAQLGFRLPNIVISPFVRKHYVSHTPMDHTAVIKFVENRFIGSSAHLTARDAAQSNLLEFFDFSKTPWITPPTPPAPITPSSLGYDPCTPSNMGP